MFASPCQGAGIRVERKYHHFALVVYVIPIKRVNSIHQVSPDKVWSYTQEDQDSVRFLRVVVPQPPFKTTSDTATENAPHPLPMKVPVLSNFDPL